MLRMPHRLDNQLAGGSNVVSLMHRPHFTPQGIVRPEGLVKLKKLIHCIGSRTRDLPARTIVPQPLRSRMIYIYIYIYPYNELTES
jgi:hypothetical protein